jgi:hypothetical protein
VEKEARRRKRHVCFFILQNIRYGFICPSFCINSNVPASTERVFLLTACLFCCSREQTCSL